jgi:transcriptional regulator with XRE-family HTH domain
VTKTELAKRINVDIKTLSNWESNKPELIKLINLGLAAEKHIEDTQHFLQEVNKLKNKTEIDKILLKQINILQKK